MRVDRRMGDTGCRPWPPFKFARVRDASRGREMRTTPRLAGLGRDDFQLAAMGLDDLAADRQAEAQADVARREERRRGLLRGLGREAGAVVLHFDLQSLQAVAAGFRVQANADFRVGRVRLEGVEHHLRQRMLERRAVAGEDDRFAAACRI